MTASAPTSEVLERLGVSADATAQPAAGGASASAWRVAGGGETFMLRRSSSRLAPGRLAAMDAARRAGLPTPALLARAAWDGAEALLLSWLPGTPMFDRLASEPAAAGRLGAIMGEAQRRLHAIKAPSALPAALEDRSHPFVAGSDAADLPDGDRLLHLDWHPSNLLVDERDQLSGIIDWDNARRGHPLLDLARTESILRVDPALASLPLAIRDRLADFLEAWADGYGPDARAITRPARRWAGRVMLADLAPRYADAPHLLRAVESWGGT